MARIGFLVCVGFSDLFGALRIFLKIKKQYSIARDSDALCTRQVVSSFFSKCELKILDTKISLPASC